MAPVRRYLRITRHSVLEVRIYLDNPSDQHRWLLQPSTNALPRIITAVRPLVLPKLQEENAAAAQARSKGGKRAKGWKDTVVGDDFEVAVFLSASPGRHAILSKEKRVKGEKKLGGLRRSVGGRMTGGSRDEPVEVGEEEEEGFVVRDEESDDADVALADIPLAASSQERSEALFVSDDEDDAIGRGSGTRKGADTQHAEVDDKKKLAFATTYDGFSIYGKILCLVVKRKGGSAREMEQSRGTGQARMEEWISSTQVNEDTMVED